MSDRFPALLSSSTVASVASFVAFASRVAMATLIVVALPATGASGQNAAEPSEPPRMADGRPDLQGVWSYATVTPLERPSELAGKEFLTEEEAAAYEAERVLSRNADLNRDELVGLVTDRGVVNGTTETRDLALAYNDFWWDRGTTVVGTRRTSLVIDPPDGRIPALTAAAQTRQAARTALSQRPTEGPEDRSLSERCILRGNAGPPMTPAGYNNNFHLIQTPGHVVIFNEQIHDARIVAMDGRSHLPPEIRQWMGDSRGRWEGDTLVVETTNFNDQKNFRGAGEGMHLIERFTRTDTETLTYEFTVRDPQSLATPWTAQIPMTQSLEPIYEYACHEGNYGMASTLSGARSIERDAGLGSR